MAKPCLMYGTARTEYDDDYYYYDVIVVEDDSLSSAAIFGIVLKRI